MIVPFESLPRIGRRQAIAVKGGAFLAHRTGERPGILGAGEAKIGTSSSSVCGSWSFETLIGTTERAT